MSFDTERLIEQVHTRRYLWDPISDGYKNKELRDNSWYDIANEIICDYDTMTDEKKEKSVEKIQRRWKSARDAYIRDRTAQKKLKMGLEVSVKKQYIYNHLLYFLDTIEHKNFSNDTDYEDHSEKKIVRKKEIQKIQETLKSCEETKNSQKKTRKRRKSTQKQTKPNIPREFISYGEDIDEDRAFFTSLLPTVREFDGDQKLIFRSEVLRLLMSIKSGSHLAEMCEQPAVSVTITPDITTDDY